MISRKTKVLIVDDSVIVRKILSDIFATDPGIEVVGTAPDPYAARDLILALKPDVITLDIEMPKMDGLTFLKLIMKHHPLPVIILSSLSQRGSHVALEALAAGAVDVMGKPSSSMVTKDMGPELIAKVKAASGATRFSGSISVAAPAIRPAAPAAPISAAAYYDPRQIILIGASTGGTEALKDVLALLPANLPPILIVQHIPSAFCGAFAKKLNDVSSFEVREAREGDILKRGLALVAPGDFHMVLRKSGESGYGVSLKQGPKIHFCRPSVDVLFESAAPLVGRRAVAGLLTGMGEDGAAGLLKLRQGGSRTFAQDQKTCVVYGMPRVAVEIGAVDTILPLDKVAEHIVKSVGAIAAKAS
jgi:two-component system chemotaxis response regulator CheB